MKTFFILFFSLGLVLAPFSEAFADTASDVAARQAALQADLARVEQQIAEQTQLLNSKQKETASIERDVAILDYQISAAKLQISAKQIQIKQLGDDIGKKVSTINTLNGKIDNGHDSLAELLRETRQSQAISPLEVALTNGSLSDLFSNVDSFQSIESALASSFQQVRSAKTTTEQEKSSLEKRRAAELDAQKVIEQEKKVIQEKEAERKKILSLSKLQVSAYQLVIRNREQERASIRNALFQLQGSKAIPFGDAYNFAKEAFAKTNVRPAFLLAILTQESKLGQNVGTCNRLGDPPEKGWQQIMKPSRDFAPFLAITQSLGIDPNTVPLSCPYKGGYGGAMGPAQFIPSTWVLYIERIVQVTGTRPPNPWLPEHAFAAASLLLEDLGAGQGGYTAERQAALRYYAGGNWNKPANAFYGNSVMNIAADYQRQIDVLQSS